MNINSELNSKIDRGFMDYSSEFAEVLLRHEIGEVLREHRNRQGRTLREVSSDANVSLGYLSEVERGQKEASSELLSHICAALNVPLSHVLRTVADRIDIVQGRRPVSFVREERTVSLEGMPREMTVAA